MLPLLPVIIVANLLVAIMCGSLGESGDPAIRRWAVALGVCLIIIDVGFVLTWWHFRRPD